MSLNDPLPFRIKISGEDTVDSRGVRSVSYRLDGLLQVSDEVLTLEWRATRHTQHVEMGNVTDEVDESPVGTMQIPRDLVSRAQVKGGVWRPRLQLWARKIDAFDAIPRARPGTLTLRIRRRDRGNAKAIAEALTSSPGSP